MNTKELLHIDGKENGMRVDSRVLEGRIQQAVAEGARNLEIAAYGQHGLGGRLWSTGEEPVSLKIIGAPGQRLGSLGFPNTRIEVMGPASDDVGWLNAGANVVIHGNASNGCCNAMAQGKVMVAGNIGARGMTMTKTNPRFQPPELWVLGSCGDYFAEFMAGGTAVICGHEPQDQENVLGYRPCVGMVGGRIFVRGPHKGFSQTDAKHEPIDDVLWQWLEENLKAFLEEINKPELFESLAVREQWQLLVARSPYERIGKSRRSMGQFRAQVWDAELGAGGMIGDLTDMDRSPISLIVRDELRRFVPVWENRKFQPPCQSSCPTGMPVQERWRLVRDGLVDEAVDLALSYSPFPATVCGYLCPNLCMKGCTRATAHMAPVDIKILGKASVSGRMPELPPITGQRVAVIGGGPAGISLAWQLRMKGHEAVIYDQSEELGGKITSVIPESRIPHEVLDAELERVRKVLPLVHLQQPLSQDEFEQMRADFDFLVIAVGAVKPRNLPVPGNERLIPALTFLQQAKKGEVKPGKRLVIIGAGNVGCDVATEAHRLGAEDITLIDIQKPAAFGHEKAAAEAAGAEFRWPCFTKEVTEKGVVLSTGELIEADTVVASIGDEPNLDFLPEGIATERAHIVVNDLYQTTDPKVFAIGDIVKPGLLTEAIGSGRRAAEAIHEFASGRRPVSDTRQMIDYSRMHLEYFDPRIEEFNDMQLCAIECSSCGACRDCGLCEVICPEHAIHRIENGADFEMVSDPEKCIGCGFCANACPCGIWSLVENTPLE